MPPQLQWCFIVASKTCYSGWWLLSLRIGPICASWSVDTWTSSIIGDCNETQDFYFKLNDLDWSDWSKQSTGTGLLPSNYMGADLVGSNLVCCLATTILLDRPALWHGYEEKGRATFRHPTMADKTIVFRQTHRALWSWSDWLGILSTGYLCDKFTSSNHISCW